MYTRIVAFHVKPNATESVHRSLQTQIASSLREQPGFVDFLVLNADKDPTYFQSITFWQSKREAETYHKTVYPRLIGLVSEHLSGAPDVREYNVDLSTFHKIAAGRAA